ncbi:MAG: hypothetical protein ACXAC2_05620 [Candidatus Kariarchaeaceae archaeon]|jgi:hypothetical protein
MKSDATKYVFIGFLLGVSLIILVGAISGKGVGRYQMYIVNDATVNVLDTQTGSFKSYFNIGYDDPYFEIGNPLSLEAYEDYIMRSEYHEYKTNLSVLEEPLSFKEWQEDRERIERENAIRIKMEEESEMREMEEMMKNW